MSRKAEGLPLTMIVVAIILLVTAMIIIFGFKSLFGRGLDDLGQNQNKAKDCDKDGVVDLFDQCPNMRGIESNNGCPATQKTPTNAGTDCLKE